MLWLDSKPHSLISSDLSASYPVQHPAECDQDSYRPQYTKFYDDFVPRLGGTQPPLLAGIGSNDAGFGRLLLVRCGKIYTALPKRSLVICVCVKPVSHLHAVEGKRIPFHCFVFRSRHQIQMELLPLGARPSFGIGTVFRWFRLAVSVLSSLAFTFLPVLLHAGKVELQLR